MCLFAPWEVKGRTDLATRIGTPHATPQVSAAPDTVRAVRSDMDVPDLRNLAFDRAENRPAPDRGNRDHARLLVQERPYLHLRHELHLGPRHPVADPPVHAERWAAQPGTGNPISGGIYGPLAGPVTGASITGVDYTGRDSGHGFAYPVARQNFALDAAANLSAVQAISGVYGLTPTPGGAYSGRLWQEGAASVDLTAAGNSVGAAASWFYVKLVRPTGPVTIG